VCVQLAFASWAIVGKVTVGVVDPLVLTFFRHAGGAVFFSLIALAQGRSVLPPRAIAGEVALLSITGLVLNQWLFTLGLKRSSAVETSLLVAMIPVCSAAYAIFSRREQARPGFWWGLLCALTGAIFVARPTRLLHGDAHLFGDFLVLLNSISYAIYLVRSRTIFKQYGAFAVLGWIFVIAVLCSTPVALYGLATEASAYTARTWTAIAYVVLMPTIFAYGANAYALARAPSALVATFVYLQPALALTMAVTFGNPLAVWLGVPPPNEQMDVFTLVGMAAILVGIWFATRTTADR
jgi:drug/metabolite transporter (DMT)-like permease